MDIQSKVVVLETDLEIKIKLRDFCQTQSITVLPCENVSALRELVTSTVQLGAIFLSNDERQLGERPEDVARDIRRIRHDIPIFVRGEDPDRLKGLQEAGEFFSAEYHPGNLDLLKRHLTESLFNKNYPSNLVKLIRELSHEVLDASFEGLDITCSQPYIIRQDSVQGSVVSMIPLETNWCRGVMYLEVRESDMIQLIAAQKSKLVSHSNLTFQSVHDLLGELTNSIWGRFKAKFLYDIGGKQPKYQSQIPVVINYGRNYLSLGKGVPQLCFDYNLRDTRGLLDGTTFVLWQRLVFYLNWCPDKFGNTSPNDHTGVEDGKVVFF